MEVLSNDFNQSLKNILYATPDYKHIVAKRKTLLISLYKRFNHYTSHIIQQNETLFGINKNESNFLEIMPLKLAFKNAIDNIDLWTHISTINTPPSIHQKTFSTYTPKGIISIFIKTQLPFYYLINTFISAIAAGNKAVIHVVEYPESIQNIIKELIEPIFQSNNVIVITTKQKSDYALKNVPSDNYTIFGDDPFYKKISFHVEDIFKLNFFNTQQYKSCMIIDESSLITQKADKLIYLSMMHNGELFSQSNLLLLHIDQIQNFKKSIAGIQKKIYNRDKPYIIKPMYKLRSATNFLAVAEMLKKGIKTGNIEILMGGTINEDTLEVSPSIVQVNPKSDYWKQNIYGPVIRILPFYNIKDAVIHLQNLGQLNKIHLFSRNKYNINAITTHLNTEQFLINEILMDRYNFNTIHAENKTYYKGVSGVAYFSNLKTVSIKKQNTNFEKLLFNKLDAFSKAWFDLFFFKK